MRRMAWIDEQTVASDVVRVKAPSSSDMVEGEQMMCRVFKGMKLVSEETVVKQDGKVQAVKENEKKD
jgi:hypothetical protein